MDLQGSASEPLISNQTVEAGQYEWVRLIVNAQPDVLDSYIEFENGDQVSLWVPSGKQTGLKLVNPFFITTDGLSNITIDFDLRKSVTDPVGLPDYILKPALRIVDNSQVGQVSGTVDPDLFDESNCSINANGITGAGGAVYLYSEKDAAIDDAGSANPPLTSALVGLNTDTGLLEYEIGFIEEGYYSIAFTCESFDDDPENDDAIIINLGKNISVVKGQTTNANFLQASLVAICIIGLFLSWFGASNSRALTSSRELTWQMLDFSHSKINRNPSGNHLVYRGVHGQSS